MSLAIIEKRPQRRPGGCAGIFCQILDWNRRLAKKKLFSKKLLPPARTVKRPTKKIGSDEKILRTKLMLIANENRGGFPSAKEEDADENLGNAMRSPGLVARLMGLESIPVIGHEKPRKALDSEYYSDRNKSGEYSRLDQDLCHEVAGQGKLDSRPQKLQKTGGFLERQPASAARFSPDVIDRNFATLSRKQQHKLASSVRSPRILSRGNQARLMQAATKILEPGLQPRIRSKPAITCNKVLELESVRSEAAIALKRSTEPQNDSLIRSCRSCGGTVELSQLRCGVKESFVDLNVSSSLECDVEDNKIRDGKSLISVQAKFDTHGKVRDSMNKKHHITVRPPHEMSPKVASKSKTSRRAELPMNRDTVVHGSRLCSIRPNYNDANEFMGSKDFVGVKKNLTLSPRLKFASKVSSSDGMSTNGIVWEKSVVRKRPNSNLHAGNGTVSNPNFMKQRTIQSDIFNKKESGLNNSQASNRNHVKKEPQKRVNADTCSSRDTGIVSFTFSSPMKHNLQPCVKEATSGKGGNQMEQTYNTFQPKRLVLNTNKDILPSLRGNSHLSGDDLSNLLEEKIRELKSLDQTEMGIRDSSERSTASILKELISALTVGKSVDQSIHNDVESKVSIPEDNFIEAFAFISKKTADEDQNFDINQKFQEGANAFTAAAAAVNDNGHPSPISIFDASSFSSESCSVGSFDMKGAFLSRPDLLDSATSVADFREKILNSGGGSDSGKHRQVGTKTRFSDEAIIWKAKLLLESILLFLDSRESTCVNSLLCDMYTTISDAFFETRKSSLYISEEADDRCFLFDYLIESLDSRYNHFCMSGGGYKIWSKLPMLLNKEQLLKEIYEEIRGLNELGGKLFDDLAERELRFSNIMWTACQAEACDAGLDIESAILKELIDELVVEFV